MKKIIWLSLLGIGLFSGNLTVLAEEPSTGAIPDPTPVVDQPAIVVEARSGLPQVYDPRADGDTSVKNQGGRGLCWAFSATASMESALMKQGKGEHDFSELYLDYYFANNATGIVNGNPNSTWRYLGNGEMEYVPLFGATRWSNPVSEDVMPYVPKGDVPFVRLEQLQEEPVVHVQGMTALPKLAHNYSEEERQFKLVKIKEQVMKESGLTYQWASGYHKGAGSEEYYNREQSAFFVPQRENNNDIDHSSLIVGWDDSYPKEHFGTTPKNDGAFIVKNSWGTSWGNQGYYYVSYEDFYIATSQMYGAAAVEETDNYEKQHSHTDFYSYVSIKSGTSSSSSYNLANKFQTGEHKELLKGIGIHTMQYNTGYEIYLKTAGMNLSDLSTLMKIGEGTKEVPGLETVKLETPIELAASEEFTVVVRYTVPKDVARISYLIEEVGSYPNVVANEGESYVSYSTDLKNMYYRDTKTTFNGNVYINAYTDVIRPVNAIELTPKQLTLYKGETKEVKAEVRPADATNQKIDWKSSNPAVAEVDGNGAVTAKSTGQATITATTEDGQLSDTATVTVENNVPITSVKITNKQVDYAAYLNKTQKLTVDIQPANAAPKTVVFESEDPSIVEINQKGELVGKAFGETTIKVYAKDNPAIYDELVVYTDDHGDEFRNATVVKVGEVMNGTYDRKFRFTYDDDHYDGDIDYFKLVVPEDGTYVIHGSAIQIDGKQDSFDFYLWHNNKLHLSFHAYAFARFHEMQLKKGDVLYWCIEGVVENLPDIKEKFVDTAWGTKYNFYVDKKENIQFGELAIFNELGLTSEQLSETLKVGDKVQMSGEVSGTQNIYDPFYGDVVWTSSNPSVAEVDYNTGVVTIKKKGKVTITAKNSFGVFYGNYNKLSNTVTFEVKN
ncbi:Ig-like domain-containing protein [Enterococcus sp. BWR-S5]|uniref:Ig-like domain-containing protein n=1 Tax=Enterococcus sp. BWR-S5 TaxID=2787714 RepID=UPI0019210F2E|nr:Ig-like domain-containing protein [Enterococcus sp. BWR-S5]MBL1224129.1 Ig-like domain-containing protein [Enterococcus sp. BWR-S5]